jgi:hypothetical protein
LVILVELAMAAAVLPLGVLNLSSSFFRFIEE